MSEHPGKSLIDRIEQWSKIFGVVAVPVLIAFFGWLIQRQVADQNLRRDYVQLAVSILTERKEAEDQKLREWAVNLLNANSSVKFEESVAAQLAGGELTLPNAPTNPPHADLPAAAGK